MFGVERDILNAATDLRSRAGRLREIAGRLETEAEELQRTVAGASAETIVLRGVAATEKLAELIEVGEDHHYKHLESLLRSAGFVCSGKDSAATLLASLSRSPHFVLIRRRSGRWRRV